MKLWFNKKEAPKQIEKSEPSEAVKKALFEERLAQFIEMMKPKALNRDAIQANIFQYDIKNVKPVAGLEGIAMDADVPSLIPSIIPDKVLEFFGNHAFIGWNACALLRQQYLIDNACSTPAKDAAACDYRLGYEDNNESDESKLDEQKLTEWKATAEREYGILRTCRILNENKKTFGIGLAVPCFEKDVDMSNPYNIDGITKDARFMGFKVVDPYWCAPQMDVASSSRPASMGFYEPTWWSISGKKIHKSWCIKVVNTIVPDILKPTYFYGGVPLPQMIYERVYAAEKTANEAPLLAMTKRMLVADGDIENFIANPQAGSAILNAVTMMRDNHGVWFKRPNDQVMQIDTPLTDFDALVMNQYQLVACIAQMPATKLLKTTPKGFNATGEYEWNDYAQSLVEIQEHDYKPLLKRFFEIFTKCETGAVVPLTVTFNPVDVPSEQEAAQTMLTEAQTDSAYVTAGVMSADEAREIIRSKEGSRYSTLPDAAELEAESDANAQALIAELEAQTGADTNAGSGQKLKSELAMDADFKESEHPRDDLGRFAEQAKSIQYKDAFEMRSATRKMEKGLAEARSHYLMSLPDNGYKNYKEEIISLRERRNEIKEQEESEALEKWEGNEKVSGKVGLLLKDSGLKITKKKADTGSIYFKDKYGNTLRISDHKQKSGGGFNQELQKRMGESEFEITPFTKETTESVVSAFIKQSKEDEEWA